jgi:hypothetical protein
MPVKREERTRYKVPYTMCPQGSSNAEEREERDRRDLQVRTGTHLGEMPCSSDRLWPSAHTWRKRGTKQRDECEGEKKTMMKERGIDRGMRKRGIVEEVSSHVSSSVSESQSCQGSLKQEKNGSLTEFRNSVFKHEIGQKRRTTYFSHTSVGVRSTVSHSTTRSTAAFSMSLHSC